MRNFHRGMVWRVWGARVARVVLILAGLGVLAGPAGAEVYVVNHLNNICQGGNFDCGDDNDAQPGDGVAERILGGGQTTLRAAIEEANALEGHDTILLPNATLFLRVDLPALTDPDGVTIMSMEDEHFVLDGSTVTQRLSEYRDLLFAKFTDLDVDMSEGLSYAETLALGGLDGQGILIVAIIHNLGFLQPEDFAHLDEDGNGSLSSDELKFFRGAGSGITINSPNNNIIGVTVVNFGHRGIVIDGESADNNTVQGCYIGLLGTDAQDRDNARLLLDNFDTADGNESDGLSLGESQTVIPGLTGSAFDRLDDDNDGELSMAELEAAGALLDSEIAQLLIDGFDLADADESDALNLAEAQTVVDTLDTETFDRLDENENGQLSEFELAIAISAGDTAGTSGTENGNRQHGIVISGGADANVIGGTDSSQRNIISGNGSGLTREILNDMNEIIGYVTEDFGHGILMTGASTSGNQVLGNYIGVDVSGVNPVPNGFSGIVIEGNASNNTIGGTEAGEGNLIARNGAPTDGCPLVCGNGMRDYYGRGIFVRDTNSSGNAILGNTITRNETNGVFFLDVNGGTIGDAADGAGNIINGHSHGNFNSANIRLVGVSNLQVEGNVSMGSTGGLHISGGSNLTIGSPGFGNVFSSCTVGVDIYNGTDVLFQSNFVGLNEAGTAASGNSFSGIFVSGSVDNVRIGGTGDGEENVISGNVNDGIVVHDMTIGAGTAPVLFIEGNLIGTNAAGTGAVPNQVIGIRIGPDARRVLIGGTTLDGDDNISGNVISGNGEDGIRVARRPDTFGTPDNIQIFGNRIGLAAAGTGLISNGLSGVGLLQVDEEVRLGGFNAGEINSIAGNVMYGVRIKGGEVLNITSHVTVRGNAIYANGDEGIFHEEAGNDDYPSPIVVGVSPISGTAPANSTVDIYADDNDEGEFYLGSTVADGSGNFSLAVDLNTLPANNITATATDLGTGNTSEFSEPLPLTPPTFTLDPVSVTLVEGDPFSLTVAASGSQPITFQWEFLEEGARDFSDVTDDGVFTGSQGAALTNSGARLTDEGSYRCVATNILGDTDGAVVSVTVVPASTDTADVSTLDDGPADGNTDSPAHLQVDPGADGQISLREAIEAANNRAGADTITFSVSGTLELESGLPALDDSAGGTTIDGGGLIGIDGNALGGNVPGFSLDSAGNILTGLAIVNFPGAGIEIAGSSATGNLVTACFIGTSGANGGDGVSISGGASDNIVGGTSEDDRNVLSGNDGSGVGIMDSGTTGNRVIGNYIGVNAAGTAATANGTHGVRIEAMAADNEIGGTADGEGNLISGNTESGVHISGTGTTGNLVLGNDIGLDANGAATLGNLVSGVSVADDATDNLIGGTDSGAGNIIRGNATGVSIDGAGTTGNTIRENEISESFADGISLSNGGNGDMPEPVITMLGSVDGTAEPDSIVEIFVDEGDEGATLIDTVTADGAGVFRSEVDLEVHVGLNVTATATDATGNTSEFSDGVLIDIEPPVITLLGDAAITLECGSGTYTDAGATAEDDVDGDITNLIDVTITQGGSPVTAIDTTTLGSYVIQYDVSDNANQMAIPVTRTVDVVDTVAPVITLSGDSALLVECSSEYVDAGATANDSCDGDLTVDTTGTVNTAMPGVYTMTYNAVDGQANAAVTVTRTVTVADRTAPIISLTGSSSVTLECGDSYLDAGATVTDTCDSDVMIETTNPVLPGSVGVYTIRYNATDASGNVAAELIRVVEVVDTGVPTISLIGAADVTVACGIGYEDPGATALDGCDGDTTVLVSGTVNVAEPGNYTLTYSASDGAGNAALPVTRIVRVVDNEAPAIVLNGSANVDVACNSTYTELGATATDSCEGDLSDNIVISGSVDTMVAGIYTVNYDVMDTVGNLAQRVTRTVTVATCPLPCETQCEDDPDNEIDVDGDGLSACEEACLGTSDEDVDTDRDGVPDSVETETGSDPVVPDSDLDLDGDGLSHLEEFIFDSDPLDPDSPATSFFIAPNGADSESGGSMGSPWSSIGYALSQLSPSAINPVRLIVGDGNYSEDVELLPWVTLVGATGSLPRIEGTVFGANNSGLENLEIAAFTSDDVMLVMDDVVMEVVNVVFRGSAARPAAGIMVDGTAPAGSVIDGCLFTSISVGIDVGGALPMVRRCTFENTSIAGVFVRATASIGAGVSLGDVNDPATGSNLFAGVVEGRAVINEINEMLLAQQNDWGTTSASTITGELVSGEVDFDPVLGPGTAGDTASLFVTVWAANNQARLGTASVSATNSSGGVVTVTRNTNGVYAFPVLRSGTYTVDVSAFGFADQEVSVTLAVDELGSQVVALQPPVIKGGGPSCAPNTGATGSLWSDIVLVALMLMALFFGRRSVGARSASERH